LHPGCRASTERVGPFRRATDHGDVWIIDARFDDLSRFLARASGSRRRLIGGLIASGGLAAFGQAADAKKGGKSDKPKEASTKAKPGKPEGAKAAPKCAGEGHPCEGNQVCCEGLICGATGNGSARRCGAATTAPNATVAPIPSYVVNVACTHDANADQSTCLATCAAPAGAAAVRSVAVASSAVCADVVGGDAALGTPGPAIGSTGFTSANGQATLKLVLTGTVTVGGVATYWCLTDTGTVPAQGPGLVRVQDDISDSTGAVEVRVAACPIGRPAPAGYDWHGQCSQTVPGAAFVLAPADGLGAQTNASASADGWARFGRLAPGSYQLTQTDGAWCHAESDGVDASGHVIVKAGQRTTVWIFECQSAGGS
jgi:hypothetical protein